MALTILGSFSAALPTLKITTAKHRVSESGSNAGFATIPKIWFQRGIDAYTTRADAGIARIQSALTSSYLPSIEKTFFIQSEGDVVRAAALYFLHPVNMALTAIHPDIRIICSSESQSTGSRPDIVYSKNGKEFAALEYKVTGVIKPGEFKVAMLPTSTGPNKIQREIEKALDNVATQSLFNDDDTVKLMKQITSYSEREGHTTDYVALFNWDYLFLCVFNHLNRDFVHGTMISGPEPELRRAFLGWLLEAYANDGRSSVTPPDMGYPPDATRRSDRAAYIPAEDNRRAGGPSGGQGSGRAGGRGDGGNSGRAERPSGSRDTGSARSGGAGSSRSPAPPRDSQGSGSGSRGGGASSSRPPAPASGSSHVLRPRDRKPEDPRDKRPRK